MYSSGRLIVRFNDVQKVKAFINGGPDPHNASEALVEGNATVSLQTEYSVDISSGSIFVVAYPEADGVADTVLDFQYWLDGEKAHGLQVWWSKSFTTREGKMFLGFVICCLLMCLGVALCACRLAKANKVEIVRPRGKKAHKDKEKVPMLNEKDLGPGDVKASLDEADSELPLKPGEAEDALETDKGSRYLSHLSLEEQVLKEFKKLLHEKLKLTPEAFFRLCDADYEKAISCERFMSMLKQLNLVTAKSSLERLCAIFDEDLNEEITLEEYYSALESYQVRGEETGPFDDDPSYISF